MAKTSGGRSSSRNTGTGSGKTITNQQREAAGKGAIKEKR